MRIAFCDDNHDFLRRMETLVRSWSGGGTQLRVDTFTNGDALLCAHAEAGWDVVFLDAIMPLFSGMEVARELRKRDETVKIVFLTASPEFAVESYTVKASNYLLKPVDTAAFYRCLDDLAAQISRGGQRIAVREGSVTYRLDPGAVEYVESQNKYAVLALTDGRTIRTAEPLYALEKELMETGIFFKSHRSYLVNLPQVHAYSAKEIRMRSGARIPIARGSGKAFEAAYFTALFGKSGET